jgi:hypothetical protein
MYWTTQTTERCSICGEPIDVGDADAVQVHASVGGLVHEQCLVEYEGGEDGREQG